MGLNCGKAPIQDWEKELIELTKKVIGYSENSLCCSNCKHSKEEVIEERDWKWICNVNSISNFIVIPSAHCNYYEE